MTFLDYTLKLAAAGLAIWTRLLGRRNATRLMVGGGILATLVAIVLQVAT